MTCSLLPVPKLYFGGLVSYFRGVGWEWVNSVPRPLTGLLYQPRMIDDDRWWRMWISRWNENWQGKQKYSKKTCPSATLPNTNPTRPDPGSRGGKPMTNRLSYGTAFFDGLSLPHSSRRYLKQRETCVCSCDRKSYVIEGMHVWRGGGGESFSGCLLRSVRYTELPVKVTKVYKNVLLRWSAYTARRLHGA
jgi:hypothetical protein